MSISLTARQLVDVKGQIARDKSWVAFRDFVELRAGEFKVEAEVLSEDFTKILKREQALGAESVLLKLLDSFIVHVENNITIEKE